MDYGVDRSSEAIWIGSMHYEVYTRDFGNQTGIYICTWKMTVIITPMWMTVDYSTSEQPAEHKSHNLLELDNDGKEIIVT